MCEGEKNGGLNLLDKYDEYINVSVTDSRTRLYHIAERDGEKGSRMTLIRTNGEIQDEIKDKENIR